MLINTTQFKSHPYLTPNIHSYSAKITTRSSQSISKTLDEASFRPSDFFALNRFQGNFCVEEDFAEFSFLFDKLK